MELIEKESKKTIDMTENEPILWIAKSCKK